MGRSDQITPSPRGTVPPAGGCGASILPATAALPQTDRPANGVPVLLPKRMIGGATPYAVGGRRKRATGIRGGEPRSDRVAAGRAIWISDSQPPGTCSGRGRVNPPLYRDADGGSSSGLANRFPRSPFDDLINDGMFASMKNWQIDPGITCASAFGSFDCRGKKTTNIGAPSPDARVPLLRD